MIWLFLFAVLFCIYTYCIFPLVLHIKARAKSDLVALSFDQWPSVSIVIAAHNEACHIQQKVATLRALDYPKENLEVVFVSDGSTDDTVTLLNEASTSDLPITVLKYAPAAGKPSALNVGVENATGDIIVFMDARQEVSANCIKSLVSYLLHDDVGAVSGELVLADDQGVESANVGLYWRYEKWIRQNESRLFSTTGATGALYAIARKDFVPHAKDVLLDDFDTPVSLLARGKRTVFTQEAVVFDQAEAQASGEFRRKARTLSGNFQSFRRNLWLFSPAKNPVCWQFVSHKVFRLLVPYAMLLAFFASLLGTGIFLYTMLFAQLVFYGLGLAALLSTKNYNNKLVNFIKVFLQLNAAAVVGAFRYFTGNANVRWKQS